MRKLLVVIIIVLIGAVIPFTYRALSDQTVEPPSKNIVVIVLDTLRVDRFGCYGSDLTTTPNLDEFARKSIRFEQAFSQAPWTMPAIASLMTSRYPVQHGAGGRRGDFKILNESVVTLAEVLQNAGAETHAITNNFFLTDRFGMTQGFDTVDADGSGSNVTTRKAGPTTRAALKWLDTPREKPFFLFVHYFDAHLVYDPPSPFRERFADPRDRAGGDYIFGTVAEIMALRKGLVQLDVDTVARLEKLYNGEVAYLDSEVGKLLAGIAERGLDSNTIVVVTSDHGEEFLDHGGFAHGHTLYDEQLHVPLMIRPAGFASWETNTLSVVRSVVRHVDIAPTLCDLVGVTPDDSFVGQSLVPWLQGKETADLAVLSQAIFSGPPGESWRDKGMKVIRRSPPLGIELYDCQADVRERQDLAEELPERLTGMITDLDLMLQAVSAEAIEGESQDSLTREELERLRSLGYVD